MSKIALDYTPAYEQGGGIGRYVREIVRALAQVDESSLYHLFVSGSTLDALPRIPGKNFVWNSTPITSKWLARLWYRARIPLPVEYFVGRVCLYHATDFVLPPTLPGTKTILTVHDLSFLRVPEVASPSLRGFLDVVVPRSICRATHVLADSLATKNDIVEVYGTVPDKITVLLSGVDRHFAVSAFLSMTMRNKLGLPGQPFILSVGTVQPRKNYGRLTKALAILRSRGYDLHLVIAGGRGWLEDSIYQTIRSEQMEPFVHFTGFIDDADLPALYKAADCVVLPSLYEGFGLPVLEAMACGTPVVTSNISSLPEVAGDAALLVDPYDVEAISTAITQILEDSALRETLTERGLAQAKRFTWENSALQLRQIYDTVLDG